MNPYSILSRQIEEHLRKDNFLRCMIYYIDQLDFVSLSGWKSLLQQLETEFKMPFALDEFDYDTGSPHVIVMGPVCKYLQYIEADGVPDRLILKHSCPYDGCISPEGHFRLDTWNEEHEWINPCEDRSLLFEILELLERVNLTLDDLNIEHDSIEGTIVPMI